MLHDLPNKDKTGNTHHCTDLNEWFSEICRSNPKADTRTFCLNIAEVPVILPLDIFKVLEKISTRKSTHPADLPPTLFKENPIYLSEMLVSLTSP